jgi:hypothetical protein
VWDSEGPFLSPDYPAEVLSPALSPGGSLRRASFQALAFRAANKRRSSAINWDAAIAVAAAAAVGSPLPGGVVEALDGSGSPPGSVKSAGASPKKLTGIGALFADASADAEDEPMSPLSPSQEPFSGGRSQASSRRQGLTELMSVAELGRAGDLMDEDLSDSSESEGSVSQDSDARLIQERFDLGRREKNEGAGGVSALASFMAHRSAEADDTLALSPMVAYRWKWFVTAFVHLRFADCAEQQQVALHNHGLFPMATELALADDAKKGSSSGDSVTNESAAPSPGGRPTRRATLFGSVMGVYRAAVQEGHVTLIHCLGDDVADISQALRVRKSKTMHRIQKPPLYFNDMPGHTEEARQLPAGGRHAVAVGGLLAALQKHSARKLEAAIAEARAAEAAKQSNSPAPADAVLESDLLSVGGGSKGSGSKEGKGAGARRSPSKRPSAISIAVEKKDTIHTHNKKHQKRMTMLSEDMKLVAAAQHAAHMALVMEEQRQHKLKDMMDRVHDTCEFHLPRPRDLFSLLRFHYDPEGLAHPANQFYTPANLLRREAVSAALSLSFSLSLSLVLAPQTPFS